MSLYDKIQESAKFLLANLPDIPKTAIMMGTGLSSIVDLVEGKTTVHYTDIPHFPQSTVQSHQGKIVVGTIEGNPVIILAGRWHYYEGYSTKEFTLPIRVLKEIGVRRIVFTNVSGGVNANYNAGDLVIIKDHINFIPDHPLRGQNDERLGPRFPDMLYTYDADMRTAIRKSADEKGITIHEGVYFALQGPSLETPAEYTFIHNIGADLVGMSTVPEVIVARHASLSVAAVSIVSNVCYPPERITETTVEEVIAVANVASDKLNKVLVGFIKKVG